MAEITKEEALAAISQICDKAGATSHFITMTVVDTNDECNACGSIVGNTLEIGGAVGAALVQHPHIMVAVMLAVEAHQKGELIESSEEISSKVESLFNP